MHQAKTLPEGICNFPIRMTTAEHALWGKFTYELNRTTGTNRSIGDVMRQALAEGAERLDAALAAQIKEARAERLRIKQGIAVLAVGLLCIFSTGDQMRLARRVTRSGKRVEEIAA